MQNNLHTSKNAPRSLKYCAALKQQQTKEFSRPIVFRNRFHEKTEPITNRIPKIVGVRGTITKQSIICHVYNIHEICEVLFLTDPENTLAISILHLSLTHTVKKLNTGCLNITCTSYRNSWNRNKIWLNLPLPKVALFNSSSITQIFFFSFFPTCIFFVLNVHPVSSNIHSKI